MTEKKKHQALTQGPISSQFIADSIAKHTPKTNIGAHSIFLGQVRNDVQNDKLVVAIEYSAYAEMAEDVLHEIRETTFAKFNLICMHIHHSIGVIKAGEISLFVFVSSKHRKEAFAACEFVVEQIKTLLPIWGKEIMEDNSIAWKENKVDLKNKL